MMAQMVGGEPQLPRNCASSMGLTSRSRPSSANYLWRLVRLDLGFSSIYGKPVASVILERLPPTIL